MQQKIDSIEVKDTYDSIPISIVLNGRSLIITGDNGCGKTRFITRIFDLLNDRIIRRNFVSYEKVVKEHLSLSEELQSIQVGTGRWSYLVNEIPRLESVKAELEGFKLKFPENQEEELLASYHKGEGTIAFFKADRQVKIGAVNAVRSINKIKEANNAVVTHFSEHNSNSQAKDFEEYLVSLKHARSLYITEYKDIDKANTIESWFVKLENDFKSLFEDPSLRMEFIIEDTSFRIIQDGKEPYRLQNLSSGYSSILSVYAELLMLLEVRDIKPENLTGIVLIDEIDAHLHISLQKKILNFLDSAFPGIQFIVTTHSPFVVMSVNNAVIYDLSKKEQVEDLSSYSYESVAKGLFRTLPLSYILQDKITELNNLIEKDNLTLDELKYTAELINDIHPSEQFLDEESSFFFKKALIEFDKIKEGKNV